MANGQDYYNRGQSEEPDFLPMQLMFQHLTHKTVSIFKVEIPMKSSVKSLKDDMASRLKTPSKFQEWIYKGEKLRDNDTFHSKKITRNEIVTVKELSPDKVNKENLETDQRKQTFVAEETQQDHAEKDQLGL